MRRALIVSILVLIIGSSAQAASIKEMAEQRLKEEYIGDFNLAFKEIKIPAAAKYRIEKECRQNFFRNKLYTWRIIKADSIAAYAVLDNVYGKTELITFMVVFDKAGIVKSVMIVKYRSSRGREVLNEDWLNKFEGSSQSSELVPGKDIDAISGATYSVNSITKGVKKLLLLFPDIISRLKD